MNTKIAKHINKLQKKGWTNVSGVSMMSEVCGEAQKLDINTFSISMTGGRYRVYKHK